MLLRRSGTDKRQNRRLLSESPVEMAVVRSSFSGLFGIGRFPARLRDKSIVGLQVQTSKPLGISAPLKIWIEPYNVARRRTLVLLGDVVWCKHAKDDQDSYYVGIRLRNEPVEAMQAWVTFVNEELRMVI